MKYFLIFMKNNEAVIKRFESYGDRLVWLSKNKSSSRNLMLFEADSLRQETEQSSTRLDSNTIDLGDLGNLIAPVKIMGRKYMVLCTTKSEKHTWEDSISMAKLQERLFGGQAITEENRACEVKGHSLQILTKDELLAIHRNFAGSPSGWGADNRYWSATPSCSGHAVVHLNSGSVHDNGCNAARSVVFEVL